MNAWEVDCAFAAPGFWKARPPPLAHESFTDVRYLPALTIAQLYKARWQVELFFRWIKQHLRIKRFLGIRENAVMKNFYPGIGKTQIWVAVSTYVLIAIVKKELYLQASLYTLRQILSVSVFEKTEISCALQSYTNRIIPSPSDNRLMLFYF